MCYWRTFLALSEGFRAGLRSARTDTIPAFGHGLSPAGPICHCRGTAGEFHVSL
jgi:hypothetical protein